MSNRIPGSTPHGRTAAIPLSFAQTARRGSFAATARDLRLHAVDAGQERGAARGDAGRALFHRTTRQVSLTPDGERLYRRCERVLAEAEDLQAEAAGVRAAPSGTLRIDMPIAYGRLVVMPVLARAGACAPGAPPGRAAAGRLTPTWCATGWTSRSASARCRTRASWRRIDWQQLIVVASPGYLEAPRYAAAHRRALSRHQSIVFRMPSSGRNRAWRFVPGGAMWSCTSAPHAGQRRRRHGRGGGARPG